MSCVTSREVPGPVGGSNSGALRRGTRNDPEDDVFDLVDANGNFGASRSAVFYDCNCNERPSFWDMEWGYSESNGPATWAEKFPLADGPRQSPVDLRSERARTDRSLISRPLYWRYEPQGGCSLSNTGYGWKVQISGPNSVRKDDLLFWFSELRGGPLPSKYRLEQFHMHWGDSNGEGSEHTVDGRSFAGELHLVHWNCEKYSSFGEAAAKPDGLAVLGVLLEVGRPHPELQKVTELLEKVTHKGQTVPINGQINPTSMLPSKYSKAAYWTYLGSLTTPPCNESVIWIVFRDSISVSEEQLQAMRALRCYSEGECCPCDENRGLMTKNFRPPLPLGNRELRFCGE